MVIFFNVADMVFFCGGTCRHTERVRWELVMMPGSRLTLSGHNSNAVDELGKTKPIRSLRMSVKLISMIVSADRELVSSSGCFRRWWRSYGFSGPPWLLRCLGVQILML